MSRRTHSRIHVESFTLREIQTRDGTFRERARVAIHARSFVKIPFQTLLALFQVFPFSFFSFNSQSQVNNELMSSNL